MTSMMSGSDSCSSWFALVINSSTAVLTFGSTISVIRLPRPHFRLLSFVKMKLGLSEFVSDLSRSHVNEDEDEQSCVKTKIGEP